MNIALIHDFLTQLGGAERVLEVFHSMFPQAPVFTIVHDREKTGRKFTGYDIRPSFIQKLPGGVKHYKWYLPFMPSAVKSFDLAGYDLILSDASAYAKGIRKPSSAVHVCYCHTPTRYLWQDRKAYLSTIPYPWPVKLAVRPLLSALAHWDWNAAQRVDAFIANSREVNRRISRFYERNSEIVYPPVDTEFFFPAANPARSYFLCAGRQEPYKMTELVIRAANKLQVPLKVAGSGTMLARLEGMAGKTVQILGRVSDEELRELYRNASAFVFPAVEDAGMAVVESLACGTPVIALNKGGVSEFIRSGENGEFFEEQSEDSVASAIQSFSAARYDSQSVSATALPYSVAAFRQKIQSIITSAYEHAHRN